MTNSAPLSPDFRKSSYSQPTGGNCVEVADLPTGTAVRDTQNRELGHLVFGPSEWMTALAAVKGPKA